MAFRLEEFKKTTRKSAGGGIPASVYPHQIKDKKALARLEIAIRLFDGSVGKRRRDMDAQAMTDFFGDPRLARGIVACLGQFYKYETPGFRQIVGQDAAASCLREAGLARPVDVRADTYAHVNEHHDGFLTEAELAACYAELGERFCLTAHQWDTLLHLDAEDNQILTRVGAVPTPADIVALYNFHSLDTALKRASADRPGRAVPERRRGRRQSAPWPAHSASGRCLRRDRDADRLWRCLLCCPAVRAACPAACCFWSRRMPPARRPAMPTRLLGTRKFRLTLGADTLRALGMPGKRGDRQARLPPPV